MTGARAVGTRRPPAALAGVLAGLTVLVASALVAGGGVPDWEVEAFRAVNDRSLLPFAVVWPVMQVGTIGAVLVSAGAAALTGRRRLGLALLAAGAAAYLLAKAVKLAVERPRPALLLADVQVRGGEAEGFGYVSGHAAVATALVVAALPWAGRRTAQALVLLALVVGLARVYVGAHLPLDVVGGAALGAAVAAAVGLAVRRAAGPAP